MAFWLAARREGQHADHIQRFDPRFWTVNFPRPMTASVVSTSPDALRVDAVFLRRADLAGLIWDSEDRLDHPLLAYRTDRDHARTTLSFRWRSRGVLPLDAINGPTLTIEGRDAAGAPRTWYVRLWNYAQGSPEDAQIDLPFSDLAGGFLLSDEADPVWPGDIDRLFISLVAPGHDGASADPLPQAVEGWVELTQIRCAGHRAMLEIGDAVVPPHGLAIATGFDDNGTQTPARVLRNLRQLGYRGSVVHYVGMSHYFRLGSAGTAGFWPAGLAIRFARRRGPGTGPSSPNARRRASRPSLPCPTSCWRSTARTPGSSVPSTERPRAPAGSRPRPCFPRPMAVPWPGCGRWPLPLPR